MASFAARLALGSASAGAVTTVAWQSLSGGPPPPAPVVPHGGTTSSAVAPLLPRDVMWRGTETPIPDDRHEFCEEAAALLRRRFFRALAATPSFQHWQGLFDDVPPPPCRESAQDEPSSNKTLRLAGGAEAATGHLYDGVLAPAPWDASLLTPAQRRVVERIAASKPPKRVKGPADDDETASDADHREPASEAARRFKREERMLVRQAVWQHPWARAPAVVAACADAALVDARRGALPNYGAASPFATPADAVTALHAITQERLLKSFAHLFRLKGHGHVAGSPAVEGPAADAPTFAAVVARERAKLRDFESWSRQETVLEVRGLHEARRRELARLPGNRATAGALPSSTTICCGVVDVVAAFLSRVADLGEMSVGHRYSGPSVSTATDDTQSKDGTGNTPAALDDAAAALLASWPNVRARSLALHVEAVKRRLANGELVAVSTGTSGHAVAVMLAPNWVAVCNRGSGAGKHSGIALFSHHGLAKSQNAATAAAVSVSPDAAAKATVRPGPVSLSTLDVSDIAPSVAAPARRAAPAADDVNGWVARLLAGGFVKGEFEQPTAPFIRHCFRDATHVGTLKMTKQRSGNCSYESCAQPLLFVALACARAQVESNAGNRAHGAILAADSAQAMLRQLSAAAGDYRDAITWIRLTMLQSHLRAVTADAPGGHFAVPTHHRLVDAALEWIDGVSPAAHSKSKTTSGGKNATAGEWGDVLQPTADEGSHHESASGGKPSCSSAAVRVDAVLADAVALNLRRALQASKNDADRCVACGVDGWVRRHLVASEPDDPMPPLPRPTQLATATNRVQRFVARARSESE